MVRIISKEDTILTLTYEAHTNTHNFKIMYRAIHSDQIIFEKTLSITLEHL